jgi:hypothetical protein
MASFTPCGVFALHIPSLSVNHPRPVGIPKCFGGLYAVFSVEADDVRVVGFVVIEVIMVDVIVAEVQMIEVVPFRVTFGGTVAVAMVFQIPEGAVGFLIAGDDAATTAAKAAMAATERTLSRCMLAVGCCLLVIRVCRGKKEFGLKFADIVLSVAGARPSFLAPVAAILVQEGGILIEREGRSDWLGTW